jgi:hypothetical protein
MPNFKKGWSRNSVSWVQASESLGICANRWFHVDFDRTQISSHHSLRENPRGVYLIHGPPPHWSFDLGEAKLWNILYVGQGNIRDRLCKHLSGSQSSAMRLMRSCFDKGKLKCSWTIVYDEREMNNLESYLIDCFRPCANEMPGHHPVVVQKDPIQSILEV